MEFSSIEDTVIRSRNTILDLLHDRGYNTGPYRNLVANDLVKLINTNNPETLAITLYGRDDLSHMKDKIVKVQYSFKSIKASVSSGKFVEDLINTEDENAKIDPITTEIIVIYLTKNYEEDNESYDKGAYEAWVNYTLKIQFFPIVRLVNNPLKHVFQPKFEIVPQEDHPALLKEWFCRNKTQFPIIKFHNDMAARCLGLVPMDIVKITSFSPTAGEYIKYRVCLP